MLRLFEMNVGCLIILEAIARINTGLWSKLVCDQIALLKQKFSSRIISRNNDVNWTFTFEQITFFELYVWGCLKIKTYINICVVLESFTNLKLKFKTFLNKIESQLCSGITKNFKKGMTTCRNDCCDYLADNVFYIKL